jgi:hypothetical protein
MLFNINFVDGKEKQTNTLNELHFHNGDKVTFLRSNETYIFGQLGRPYKWISEYVFNQNDVENQIKIEYTPRLYDFYTNNNMQIKGNIIPIDIKKLSDGLYINLEDSLDIFSDGRIMGLISEKILAATPGWLKSTSNVYDITDNQKHKLEVRSITNQVIFSPSKNIGIGRKFNENDLLKKFDSIYGFLLIDLNKLDLYNNQLYYIIIKSDIVKNWYCKGLLGKNCSKNRKAFFQLLETEKYYNAV